MLFFKLFNKIIRFVSPSVFEGGVISITFDDQWHSAYTNALPILNNYRYPATWYICTDNVGKSDPDSADRYMTWEEILNLKNLGHEIGSHTVTHCDFKFTDKTRIARELKESKRILLEKAGVKTSSFAYPYTRIGWETGGPQASLVHYATARGGEGGFNFLPLRRFNLYAWKAYENLYAVDYLKCVVDTCALQNKWLIFYTHDVSDNPSEFGCSPQYFNNLLAYIHARKIKVKTITEVSKAVRFF